MSKKIVSGIIIIIVILSNSLYLSAQEEQPEAVPGEVEQEELALPSKMGLTVHPGGMVVQYLPLGITYDFYESVGIPLSIYNKDVISHTYILSSHKPSNVATRTWLKGYLEVPDASWLWFEKDEVRIEPNSKAEVKMYLKIPDEEKYYNQHWTVALGVKGKPEPGQVIALAVYPRFQIETLAKDELKERPDGIIGCVPSIISFPDFALGKTQKQRLRIYNNDTRRHRYRIGSRVFPEDPTRELIITSPAYSWIPNPSWIKPDKSSIIISGQGNQELTISIKVPRNKENYNRDWEGILFIEPEEGLPGFVRVQIKTERITQLKTDL